MDNEIQNLFSQNVGEYNYIIRDGADEFLVNFCKTNQPKNILEIGTAYGYSAYLMATSCDCTITTIELDKNKVEIAKQNIEKVGLSSKINFICGDAKEKIQTLTQKYDLIFLDGPKGQYIKYLPTLIELLNSGGYLVADNVYYLGRIFKQGTIPHKYRTIVNNLRKFIEQIKTNEKLQTTLYNIGDGISVSKKIKQ